MILTKTAERETENNCMLTRLDCLSLVRDALQNSFKLMFDNIKVIESEFPKPLTFYYMKCLMSVNRNYHELYSLTLAFLNSFFKAFHFSCLPSQFRDDCSFSFAYFALALGTTTNTKKILGPNT